MRPKGTSRGHDRLGFTMVELVIVITIASILIGFAVPRLNAAMHQRDVNGARDGVILLAARARVQAMEMAEVIEFHLDTDNGVAAVIDPGEGDTLEILNFADERGVEAESTPAQIKLCYTSRGYATQPCSTALGGTVEVGFARSGHEAELVIWQLGQVRKP